MSQKFETGKLRDTVEPQRAKGDSASVTALLACICGIFVLAFGGLFVMANASTAEAIVASVWQSASETEIGKRRWATLHKKCDRKAFRGRRDGGKFERAVEQAAMMQGIDSGSVGRLIVCMGAPSKQNFCNRTFRQKFNDLVIYHGKIAGNGPSDMEIFSHTMAKSFGGRKVRTSIDRRKAIKKRIRSLFMKGLLRRDEFRSFLHAEPEWLTKIIGERKQPEPCGTA